MTMTHKESYKQGFGPFAPEVYRAPGPYPYRGVTSRRRARGVSSRSLDAEHESVACVVARARAGRGRVHRHAARLPGAAARALPRARDPLRRRRGAVRRRPHRAGLGDRALRRRAGPARLGQVARRRAAAGRGHRPRRADGRARGRRARRHVRREPGRLRGGAGGARRDRARRLPTRAPRSSGTHLRARLDEIAAASRTSARCAASARCSPSSS